MSAVTGIDHGNFRSQRSDQRGTLFWMTHGTDEDVKRIMGAYVPEREEDRKLKTSGKYTDLGDGYILPGYVISVVKRMPGEEEA